MLQNTTAPTINIGDCEISRVFSSKSLGVHIDENLSWSLQIDKMVKRISSVISGLKLIRPFVSEKTLITTYKALILPQFDYCDQIWGNAGTGNLECLQKLQNRAARVITRSGYEIRSKDILKSLKGIT